MNSTYPEIGDLYIISPSETGTFVMLITQSDLEKKEGTFKYFKTLEEAKEFCNKGTS